MSKGLINSFKAFAIALVLGAVVFVGFAMPWFGPRLIEGGKHFGEQIGAFWSRITGGDGSASYLLPSIGKLEPIDNVVGNPDMGLFWGDVGFALRLLVTKESAVMSSMRIVEILLKIVRWVLFIPLVFLLLKIVFDKQFEDKGLGPDYVSDGARFFEKYVTNPIRVAVSWFLGAFGYFRQSFLFWPTIILLAFGLNIPAICIDFIGEYLYFFISFDFLSLLDFFVSALVSLALGLSWMKPWMFGVLAYLIFIWIRKNIGEQRLRYLLAKDKSVVGESTGVFNLILGKMRASKTTILVSMSRLTDQIFHEQALENMEEVASLFPSFPFIKLERAVMRLDHLGLVHNRIQVSAFVSGCFRCAANRRIPHYPFGYEGDFFKGNGNVIRDLESCLKIYAESYWLYYHDSPLIAGNIAVRTDGVKADLGHFPLWDFDSLNRPLPTSRDGTTCKILDWNMARLGKKVSADADFSLALDGCCLAVSEIAKERGNALDNAIYKKDDLAANPKNDYFDATLKMGGHLAYVGGKPFFKVISDDQRSGSVGQNLVDVAETIFTVDRNRIDERLALPFYWIEPMVLGWLNAKSKEFWERWRNCRDDQTLVSRFFFWLMGWSYRKLSRIYNRYGYKAVRMATNSSDSVGNLIAGSDVPYYVLYAVDYAYRFDSASFSGFLNTGKDEAENGFFDLPSFGGITATRGEFEQENSYLVRFLDEANRRNP